MVRRLHTNAGTNEKLYETKENVRRACLYPWERIVLTAKGMLSYCPTDWFGKAVICDYRINTIKDIWTSRFYDSLREEHLTCNFKKSDFCKQCPDWANTSWPKDENKSYADLVEEILYKEA